MSSDDDRPPRNRSNRDLSPRRSLTELHRKTSLQLIENAYECTRRRETTSEAVINRNSRENQTGKVSPRNSDGSNTTDSYGDSTGDSSGDSLATDKYMSRDKRLDPRRECDKSQSAEANVKRNKLRSSRFSRPSVTIRNLNDSSDEDQEKMGEEATRWKFLLQADRIQLKNLGPLVPIQGPNSLPSNSSSSTSTTLVAVPLRAKRAEFHLPVESSRSNKSLPTEVVPLATKSNSGHKSSMAGIRKNSRKSTVNFGLVQQQLFDSSSGESLNSEPPAPSPHDVEKKSSNNSANST